MKITKNQSGGAGLVALIILGSVFGMFVLWGIGIALNIAWIPFHKIEKKVDLNYGVINKTYGTDYCLSNYEWFKDTYQSIQQSDTQIANAQAQLDQFVKDAGARDKWTFEDKQNYNNLTTQITGIKNYKADLVGQYNSRTSQLNRVACKELPLFVNP